jgi:hypothetical protein
MTKKKTDGNVPTPANKLGDIKLKNIIPNKLTDLAETSSMFHNLQDEFKNKLTPFIHNIDEIITYDPMTYIHNDQCSTISNNLDRINAELRASYSVLKSILENLEI